MANAYKVVIPARYASTRLPGKPLRELLGKPMLQYVFEASCQCGAEQVVIATDDGRIEATGKSFGAEVCMTSSEHASGTDRLAEVVKELGWSDDEIVVNVQGDEPLLSGDNIDVLVRGLLGDPEAPMATLCRPLDPERMEDSNAVKVVRDARGRALYFSRSLIPYPRATDDAQALWRLHLGIYCFRREALARFVALSPSPLEKAEGLEQLRALENGIPILVLDAPHPAFGVDSPEDLQRVKKIMQATN